MKVVDILNAKKSSVATIVPGASIGELTVRPRDSRISAMVVSQDGVAIEGIVTERDVTYGLGEHLGGLHALPVSALMTHNVVTCSPADDVGKVGMLMMQHHIRHLPVEVDGQLVGLISLRDVFKHRMDELQQRGQALRQAISATE